MRFLKKPRLTSQEKYLLLALNTEDTAKQRISEALGLMVQAVASLDFAACIYSLYLETKYGLLPELPNQGKNPADYFQGLLSQQNERGEPRYNPDQQQVLEALASVAPLVVVSDILLKGLAQEELDSWGPIIQITETGIIIPHNGFANHIIRMCNVASYVFKKEAEQRGKATESLRGEPLRLSQYHLMMLREGGEAFERFSRGARESFNSQYIQNLYSTCCFACDSLDIDPRIGLDLIPTLTFLNRGPLIEIPNS